MIRTKPANIDLSAFFSDPREFGKYIANIDRLSNIIDIFDEGVEVVDADGIFCVYNRAQEELNNVRANEVIGKHVTEVYNLNMDTSLLLKVLKTGTPIYGYHQQYSTVTGKSVNIICNILPIKIKGETIGAAAITKDFSGFLETTERILLSSSSPGTRDNSSQQNAFESIITQNSNLLEALKWAKISTQSDSNVLIYGETGTGKELFANGIHYLSKRNNGPFITINCAAMPESLLEGILFGTVKGSFTGAVDKIGLLEQAHEGTILLDEINSMPPSLQGKILRVLEEKKVRKLGSKKEVQVDIRIISTCNEDPAVAIKKGSLRSDLFYRLAVVYISIPPLRERLDDLDLLINHFIQSLDKQFNKQVIGVDSQLAYIMKNYHWPGNIRQLKHCIECAMNIISYEESYISLEHIPLYLRQDFFRAIPEEPSADNRAKATSPASIWDELKNDEIQKIIKVLKGANGNISQAAKQLGVSRQSLQYKLRKYGIK